MTEPQPTPAAPEAPPIPVPAPPSDAPGGPPPADRGGPGGDRGGPDDQRGPGGRARGPGDRPRRPGGGGGGRRFGGRRRTCRLCNKVRCSPGDEYKVDYKDVDRLRHFINDRGKIDPRRKLATCALAQRAISRAVKRARHLGLLPYTIHHIRQTRIFPIRG